MSQSGRAQGLLVSALFAAVAHTLGAASPAADTNSRKPPNDRGRDAESDQYPHIEIGAWISGLASIAG